MTQPNHATVVDARDALVTLPGVESAAILPATAGRPRQVSIVLAPGYDRAPPRVLSALVDHDLGVADVSPQGDRLIVAAV